MNEYIIDGKNVKIEKKFPTFNIHIDGELYQVASERDTSCSDSIYLSPIKASDEVKEIIKESIDRYFKDVHGSKISYTIE